MHLNQITPHLRRLIGSEHQISDTHAAKTQQLTENPIRFFQHILGFTPTSYQQELAELFQNNQFIAARWCRQAGKSYIISALLLWHAITHPENYIAIVAPSLRQAKLIIRRIAQFTRKLPSDICLKPLKTQIHFTNGSTIEAFPNSPETIRGPTLNIVYADEFNFIPNDTEMYDAILFTLSATNGKFICTSTPWSTDSIFHKIFNHEDYADYTKHHVTWQQALEPNGPLKQNILQKIQKQFAQDPWRWKREMEADWSEDETVWLPQSLITKCIDGTQELYSFHAQHNGRFNAGLDLGKHRDHSVLIINEEQEGKQLLRHWKVFPLETQYATVIGYIKTLTDRWKHIERIRVDTTGIGEYVTEDMKTAGVESVEPITFTSTRKQELANHLKQQMLNGTYRFPFIELRLSPTVQLSYPAELNVERFTLRKDGSIGFSHPQGQHDDTFWATALAVSCSTKLTPEPTLRVVTT